MAVEGSLPRWTIFNRRKIPGTNFCYRLSRFRSHNVAGRIMSLEKCSDLIHLTEEESGDGRMEKIA
jgi:hypothetical protein